MENQELLAALSDMLDEKFRKELAPVKEELSELKEDVSGLKKDVSELKEDVSVLKEDVSELKEDVSVLKEDVSELKEDVSVLKEDVSELKEDVSGLKKDVSELKEDVSDIKLRVKTLEITLENETNKNIEIIAEGHSIIDRKLDQALSSFSENEFYKLRVNRLDADIKKIAESYKAARL